MSETGVVSFARDIAPLFREVDIAEMQFVMDLSSFEDVREYAELILKRVADGSMPCDGPWSAEQIALFERWIAGGHQP